jgi:hypothetical protein
MLIFSVILLAIIVGFVYLKGTHTKISKEELIATIKTGYPQQFCNVIFPQIKTCVTLKDTECINFATSAIELCINDMQSSFDASYDKEAAREIYKKISNCYERNLHDTLMQKYVIPDEKCWNMMR